MEYINPPTVRRRRARRGGRRGEGGGIGKGFLDQVANGAMSLLGKGLSALITGFGDYKIAENTLMTGGLDPPTVINSVKNGGVIVRHREYLQDINASTPFNITTLAINPGILTTFPWLSAIASHFEQYKFRGLLFEFKSLASDAVLSTATSSALGSVVMATQYNALNPPFINKFTMENYEFANSAKPSLSFIHPIECAKTDTSVQELYVRTGTPVAGSDLRLYDLGNFNIASVGMQASVGVCGELWCTYEIELLKPKLESIVDVQEQADHFQLNTIVNATPFINNIQQPNNTLGGTLTSNVYTFPSTTVEGRFIVVWNTVSGIAGPITAPSIALFNADFTSFFNGGASRRETFGSAVGAYSDMVVIDILGPSATLTYGSFGVYPPLSSNGDFLVLEMPSNLTNVSSKQTIESKLSNKICVESCNEYTDSSDYEFDIEQQVMKMVNERLNKLGLN